MAMINTAQFKKGMYVMFHDEPHMIVDIAFVSPGKGSAFYRTKLRALNTGRMVEFTFKSGEKVEEVYVETNEGNYSYFDGSNYVFIEPRTFEQYEVSAEVVGKDKIYLKEGLSYRIQFYRNVSVGIKCPKSISCEVTETEMAVKGNTVNNALKPALLDTGAKVQVPLFVKKGDVVTISTETGEYLSRK
ncbi:elongation factor P [Patescibacteria group bacterium]|nr:elongation factor P [Patescibacteria group bacterium]MCG2702349.1 elongation factor P [Candidatus Parcubacteria bacterium]MBU4264961.1 elongation factor P [Patescibacteria group bacterium]MBU4389798.1 elongation factor P [Patescibacteria group bacterium]MBU4396896.1 elongation factor P [Patescibacteria group bacterium]